VSRFQDFTIPPSLHPLVRRIFEEMKTQEISKSEMARRIGIRRESIWLWERHNPQLLNLEAAGTVLGLKLKWVRDTR